MKSSTLPSRLKLYRDIAEK